VTTRIQEGGQRADAGADARGGAARRRRVRLALPLLLLVVGGLAGISACTLTERARDGWSADFEGLLVHLERGYPNLEWIVERRGLDACALAQQTRTALAQADSHFECASAVRRFVAAFGDPHLRIREPFASSLRLAWRGATWSRSEGGGDDRLPRTLTPDEACERLGCVEAPLDFALDFDALPGFEALPASESQPFAAGLLPLPGGGLAAVLRLGSFGLEPYRDCGRVAWSRLLAQQPDGDLDAYAAFVALCDEIVARLSARLEEFTARGCSVLLVDLTGNGGGTDWVDPAARLFSGRALVGPRAGLLRGPATVAQLGAELEAVRRALAAAAADAEGDAGAAVAARPLAPAERATLEEAALRLERLLEDAAVPVDRRALFREPGGRAASSLLVQCEAYTTGAFGHLPPDALPGLAVRTSVFHPLRFRYREGVWDGPLVLLVDGATASAAEQFVAMLVDAGAAWVVGARTMGAGGGYMAGGDPYLMRHSGWEVLVPNCCRLRADGSAELEGIAPDAPLDVHAEGWQDALLRTLVDRAPGRR